VILAATLNAVPSIPAIGLVLVLSVDWFIGMVQALGNLIGNCVATVVIAAWEKDLNLPLAERVLDNDVVVEARAACRLTILPASCVQPTPSDSFSAIELRLDDDLAKRLSGCQPPPRSTPGDFAGAQFKMRQQRSIAAGQWPGASPPSDEQASGRAP